MTIFFVEKKVIMKMNIRILCLFQETFISSDLILKMNHFQNGKLFLLRNAKMFIYKSL